MKSIKDNLTNEKLKSRFKSQFDLVNYAIKRAESMVEAGRVPKNLSGQNQDNVALHTLYEIVNGKDKFPSKFDSDNDEDSES